MGRHHPRLRGALTACAILLAAAPPASARFAVHRAGPTDPLSVTVSGGAAVVFHAENALPGDRVASVVTVRNKGGTPLALVMDEPLLRSPPGPNGGRLGAALVLTVREATGARTLLYQGRMAGLGTVPLGVIPGGATQRLSIDVRFPDRGRPPSAQGGDNAYQGATLRATFRWRATAGAGVLGVSETGTRPIGGRRGPGTGRGVEGVRSGPGTVVSAPGLSPSAGPGGDLPFTGLAVGVVLLLGLGAIGAGAILRRRAGRPAR